MHHDTHCCVLNDLRRQLADVTAHRDSLVNKITELRSVQSHLLLKLREGERRARELTNLLHAEVPDVP
jgi:hypothetical protein